MTLDEYTALFSANADKKYDEFNKKLLNSKLETIGCRVPFVRSVAKKYAYDLDGILALPYNRYYEIDMLKGIAIGRADLPYEKKTPLLDEFAAHIENWAVCDVSSVKFHVREAEKYFDYFVNLTRKYKYPFIVRYGIVSLLGHFLDDGHIDGVFSALEEVVYGEYYVDMAAAWLIATAMAKCRDKTLSFMQGAAREKLNVFTYNRALQKMRDSYRISEEDKRLTYSLKRT